MNDRRQAIRRNRVFRDWSHPLKRFDNVELDTKFRFRRQDVTDLTDEIKDDIELANRHDTLPPLLRVSTTLRFDASGSFQDVCGELAGVQQCTASWTITSVGTVWWKDRWQLGHTATCEIHSQTLKLYNHLAAKQAPTNIGSSAVSFSSDIASGARMDAQSTTTVISGWKYLPSQPRQLYLGENTIRTQWTPKILTCFVMLKLVHCQFKKHWQSVGKTKTPPKSNDIIIIFPGRKDRVSLCQGGQELVGIYIYVCW